MEIVLKVHNAIEVLKQKMKTMKVMMKLLLKKKKKKKVTSNKGNSIIMKM